MHRLILILVAVLLSVSASVQAAGEPDKPDVLWAEKGVQGQILDTFDIADGELVLTLRDRVRMPDPATVSLRLPGGGIVIPARICQRALCFPADALHPSFDPATLDWYKWDEDREDKIGSEAWVSEARWALHDALLHVDGTTHRLPSFALPDRG